VPFRIKVFVSIVLAFLVLLLVGPLLLPVPPLEGTVPAESLAGEDSSFVRAGGVTLHYLYSGDGPPAAEAEPGFLLLHGYPANAESWRAVLPELALFGPTVALDRPGFGLSERKMPGTWSRGRNPYRLEAQVEQAVSLLEELGVDRAVWIGSSSGAITALRAAASHPDRVAGLVLVGAPVYGARAPPAWSRPLLHTPQLDRLGPLLMRQLGGEPGLRLYASQWAQPDLIGEQEIDAFGRTFRVDDWDRGLWEVSKASRNPDLDGLLSGLELPVLVVAGAADPIVAPEDSQRLANEIPGATLALMDGCGHLPHLECPAEFMTVLSAWLGTDEQ
jgi:pimeloyl-ACP methyl ester carboxylesterase